MRSLRRRSLTKSDLQHFLFTRVAFKRDQMPRSVRDTERVPKRLRKAFMLAKRGSVLSPYKTTKFGVQRCDLLQLLVSFSL